MSRSTRSSLPLLALASSLSACMGGAPLSLDDGVAPPACAPPVADPAPVAVPDAGSAPHRSFGFWMSDGFVRDMRAAGFSGKYDSEFEVADAFSGFVSYGMDIVTLNQGGSLASAFGLAPLGGPTSLIVDGDADAVGRPIVPLTGNWLANFVYDGMTNVVETTNGDTTIRESPGGRVHCELARQYRNLACAFRGVIRADFR